MEDLIWHLKHSTIIQLILFVLFFTSGLLINILQAALYFCVRPINKHVYRKLNYYPSYWLYANIVFAAEWWGDLDITLYCDQQVFDQHLGKEHALCLMNHSYEIDWMLGYVFCYRMRLLGNLKMYGKKSIQYVPLIGWSLKFGESIFLTRHWEKDKKNLDSQVTSLAEYKDPISGTRFTASKCEKSQQFAREKGLPVLKHHLTPRTKGFTASVPFLRGKVPAVYDIQLAFDKGPNDFEPTVINLLNGERVNAHLYIRRVTISELPEDDVDLAKWLHNVYRVKDALAESFNTTGSFFTNSGVSPVPSHHLHRRPHSLITTVVWHLLVLLPMMYWLVVSVSPSSLVVVGGVLAAVSLVRSKMIAVTKIDQGSQYGVVAERTCGSDRPYINRII